MVKSDILSVLLLLLYFSNGALGKVSPDFIHPCPGLTSECLKKTIQETIPYFVKGIPELGIMPIDPIAQDYIGFNLPGGVKIEFFDGRMTGIKKCIVDDVKYKNYTADINLHCHLLIKGNYKAHGKVLIVHVNGEGDAKIKVKNITMHAILKFEDKVRNGTMYHEIKNISVTHEFTDKVLFDLSNLFKGKPEISDAILHFLNENWKIVVEEFADPIIETIVNSVNSNIKAFFAGIPKEEIII